MAENRKLGRTASHRQALLKNQVTQVILHGQIKTTEQKAKEVKSIVDSLMSLAVKEQGNYEMVSKKVSRAKLDSNGKKVTETVTSKNGNKYTRVVREIVTEEVKQDKPSRLAARRTLIKNLNKVKENGKNVDLPAKMFDELAPKYKDNNGGYTRIVKLGKRKGDNAEEVILQLI
jgi:large subunit ribosomal protein L17